MRRQVGEAVVAHHLAWLAHDLEGASVATVEGQRSFDGGWGVHVG